MPEDWISKVLPWLPTTLTLAGWWIVNRQNNTRELRKEARGAADDCKKLVREAADMGVEYWKGKPDISAWKIKALLEELEVEVCRFDEGTGRQKLLEHHVDLLEAIMGYDFDNEVLDPKPATHQIWRDIAKARQKFLFEIEHQFSQLFH